MLSPTQRGTLACLKMALIIGIVWLNAGGHVNQVSAIAVIAVLLL